MKGIIGVPCGDMTRYPTFWSCLGNLGWPSDQQWAYQIEPGASVAANRNKIIQNAINTEADWIFFLDDDHVFPPGTLISLLAHDLPIVSALYTHRVHPNLPVLYDRYDPRTGAVLYRHLSGDDKGLVEVAATGAGALLLRRDAFTRLHIYTNGKPFTLGQIEKDQWGDDLTFFKYARECDLKIFVDLDTPVGHIGQVDFWPHRNAEGNWEVILNDSGLLLIMPDAKIDESEVLRNSFKRV